MESSPKSGRDLLRSLRAALLRASNAGTLQNSPEDIHSSVKMASPASPLASDLRARGLSDAATCIVGGDKNQHRDNRLRHFLRNDGAWFDFSITVRGEDAAYQVLAHDFEIRLPPNGGVPFLRFDLNLPGHQNESRGARAHFHAGSDELLVPSFEQTPGEILDLFLNGLRNGRRASGREPRPRRRTEFEVKWLRDALKIAEGST